MHVWEENPFHEGDEIDANEWERIIYQSNMRRASSIAVGLLARSEHSRFLLARKLAQRDLPNEVIEPTLDRLQEVGHLSDERFAESWVRSRLGSHPEGRAHLIGGLRQRGIRESEANAAIDRALEEIGLSIDDVARSFVERIARRKSPTTGEIEAKLYRRGFSRDVIRRVLSSESETE